MIKEYQKCRGLHRSANTPQGMCVMEGPDDVVFWRLMEKTAVGLGAISRISRMVVLEKRPS